MVIGWFEQAYTERLRHEACRTSHDMIYPSWGPGVVMPFMRLVLVVVGVGGWTLPAPATPASQIKARYSTGILYIISFLFARNTARCGGGRTRIAFAGRRTSERLRLRLMDE